VHRQGRPLWQKLVDDLEAEIRSGARRPGSKLPSVAEQEAQGISQSTTMRAYRELAAMGLTQAVAGSGTYVADPVPEHVTPTTIQALVDRITAQEARLEALEEWRRHVEGSA
jgi:DNA-binding GntR family transcriptional regulator